jgi:S-formylglutathione hydrolase FrmB
MLIVVVDGWTKWGGSQYLNSPAQGNYADFVCQEAVAAIEALYPVPASGIRRIIAGHSSGGFGALRLGMANQHLFDGVIALSPDSDFPVSHLPLVRLPGVTNVPLAEVERIALGKEPLPKNGDLQYALGLSAAYAARDASHPGEFEWLYDAQGQFRQDVWQRWLDNDPLAIIRRDPKAFLPSQRTYLEGAAHDQFLANVGAREMYELLRGRGAQCAFYEPPGQHSDHVPERLERGLAWLFGRPLQDIK